MTENEAKDILEEVKVLDDSMYQYNTNYLNALDMAIKVLEEIQHYRAIGTVEECREARERQRGKKVSNRTLLRDLNGNPYTVRGDCPNCGSINLVSTNTDYCNACGQKLDWSDTP